MAKELNRIHKLYKEEVAPKLIKEFGYKIFKVSVCAKTNSWVFELWSLSY